MEVTNWISPCAGEVCTYGGNLAEVNHIGGEKQLTFKVALEPSAEGGYTVYVPALLGCISEEALQNIRESIGLYLEPVPEPQQHDFRQTLRPLPQ